MSIFKILHSYITLIQLLYLFFYTKRIVCWQKKFFTFADAETASLATIFSTTAVCLLRVSFSDSRIAILSFRLIRDFLFCLDMWLWCYMDLFFRYVMIFSSQESTCLTLQALRRLLKQSKPAGARSDFQIQGLTGSFVIWKFSNNTHELWL